jgi:hypothetical protein
MFPRLSTTSVVRPLGARATLAPPSAAAAAGNLWTVQDRRPIALTPRQTVNVDRIHFSKSQNVTISSGTDVLTLGGAATAVTITFTSSMAGAAQNTARRRHQRVSFFHFGR